MSPVVLKLGQATIGRREVKTRRIPHSLNHRLHWAERKAWNDAWYAEVKYAWLAIPWSQRPEIPFKKPNLTFTLHTIRELDWDNAFTCLKPLIDSLKEIGILEDDDPKHLPQPKIVQKTVGHKDEEHVEIQIAA